MCKARVCCCCLQGSVPETQSVAASLLSAGFMSKRRQEEPESWGSLLRSYRATSAPLTVELEQRPRPCVPKSDFNPITATFVDPEAEAKQREAEHLVHTRSGWRNARQDSKFDILTGKPRFGDPEAQQRPAIRRVRHATAQSEEVPAPRRTRRAFDKESVERRDYDIISTRYISDHEAKSKADADRNRAKLATKYWHHNPLAHPEEEKKARELAAEKVALRRRRKEETMPERLRYSEGAVVDIVTGLPKDEQRLQLEQARKDASRRRERDIERRRVAEERALRRVSVQRFAPAVSRGYDIISPSQGTGTASAHRPLGIREASWARLTGAAAAEKVGTVAAAGTAARVAKDDETGKLPPVASASAASS